MTRATPTIPETAAGFGIYVHANHDWLRARETSLAVLVFRSKSAALAYLSSQSAVHGEVLPFQWRE